jgi:hypothetical protein
MDVSLPKTRREPSTASENVAAVQAISGSIKNVRVIMEKE